VTLSWSCGKTYWCHSDVSNHPNTDNIRGGAQMAPQPRLRRSGRRFDELGSLLLVETSLSNIHKRQPHHCRRHWPFLGMEAESEPREGLPRVSGPLHPPSTGFGHVEIVTVKILLYTTAVAAHSTEATVQACSTIRVLISVTTHVLSQNNLKHSSTEVHCHRRKARSKHKRSPVTV
jgi:hypothetical protein